MKTLLCNVCFTLSHSLVSFRIQTQAWTSQSAFSSLSILANIMVHGKKKRLTWSKAQEPKILKLSLSSDSFSDFTLQCLFCYILWGVEEPIYTRPRIWINCSLMTGSIWHLKNSSSTYQFVKPWLKGYYLKQKLSHGVTVGHKRQRCMSLPQQGL